MIASEEQLSASITGEAIGTLMQAKRPVFIMIRTTSVNANSV
jgi:hypothetical protein